jgi:hypothetical protein
MSRRIFLATIVSTALGLTIATQIARAQSRAVSGARVHASVEIDPRGVFVYRYALENGASSTAGISKMTIDVSLPAGAAPPSAAGLVHGPGYFTEPSGTAMNSAAGKAIPIGLSAPQPGWRATVGRDATARWVAVRDANFVFPKQKLAGFSIASHGPPALRRFNVVPHIDPDRAPITPPGDDPGESDRYKQEFDQYVESQSVVGITLAPTSPATLTADGLLANLVGQVAQARTARWIASDAAARKFTEELQAARGGIARKQFESAGNILRAIRTEVAAQSGKALTSEAVALVDVNIQYALPLLAKR